MNNSGYTILPGDENPPNSYGSTNSEQSNGNVRGSIIENTKFCVQGLVDMALLTSNISQFHVQYLVLHEALKAISEGKVVEHLWVMKFILVLIGVSIFLHICVGFVMLIHREITDDQRLASTTIPKSLCLKIFINCSYFAIVIINVVINILIQ